MSKDLERLKVLTLELNEKDIEMRRENYNLKSFFDNAPSLLFTLNINGDFQKTNPFWFKSLGWNQSDLNQVNFLELFHDEDKEAAQRAYINLLNGNDITGFIGKYKCKDGSYKKINWIMNFDPKSEKISGIGSTLK